MAEFFAPGSVRFRAMHDDELQVIEYLVTC